MYLKVSYMYTNLIMYYQAGRVIKACKNNGSIPSPVMLIPHIAIKVFMSIRLADPISQLQPQHTQQDDCTMGITWESGLQHMTS